MIKVAVLGLGAMGSRMAMNLIHAGHQVKVWNRSSNAAEPLVAAGATQATTPKEAAAGQDFVIAMVRDNDASRQIWLDPHTGALAGMDAGAVAIESSTLTVEWIRELGNQVAARGCSLLEAPVSGSLPQVEAAQLIYLVGGDEATLQKAEPLLKTMASAIHHVGALGTGTLAKLTTNTLLGVQVTVLAEMIGMLKHANVDIARIMAAVAATPVWSPVAQRLSGNMLAENFTPQFPIELIEKDFGYTVQAAGSPNAAPMVAAARSVFQQAMKHGYGKSNMTAVVQLYADQKSE
jgi:3-hydroxyisobutyrate dehydrogenase